MIPDVDWEPIKLVDIEVEPSERCADERYVYPVFSRRPNDVWADAFIEAALFDEYVTWDAVRGLVIADSMRIDVTHERLRFVTTIANVAFCQHLGALRDASPGDASRLVEEEALQADLEESWVRLGG